MRGNEGPRGVVDNSARMRGIQVVKRVGGLEAERLRGWRCVGVRVTGCGKTWKTSLARVCVWTTNSYSPRA